MSRFPGLIIQNFRGPHASSLINSHTSPALLLVSSCTSRYFEQVFDSFKSGLYLSAQLLTYTINQLGNLPLRRVLPL